MGGDSVSEDIKGRPSPKTVPEAQLIGLKKGLEAKIKQLEVERARAQSRIQELEDSLKVKGLDEDDEDAVSEVKKHLLAENRKLKEEKEKFEQQRSDYEGRLRSVRIRELVNEYGIEAEALSGLEDINLIENEALKLRAEKAEKLIKEKEEELTKVKGTPSGVYETGSPAVAKKDIWAMSEEEFEKYKKELVKSKR